MLELDDSDRIEIGDRVVAIGHPEQGGLWTLTTGTISAQFENFNATKGKSVFQTETGLNRGNSGGPLLDTSGRMVGVNTAIARLSPDGLPITSISFSLKSNVAKQWLRVQDQRMDGVIIVDPKRKTARCTLFRYLKSGDLVVTGSAGVRTVRKTESRDVRGSAQAEHEFSFMGAGVSSERRVEVLVDQISWEMHRIRGQDGRIVVVPGPVVIHTGGGEHLEWLVREGYVQALLGGNAVAVHDIEQALFGTSLGVDLKLGTSVEGGHRHHLRAINTIRGAGGISKAVEQGALTSGIFHECVRKNIPFVLAGSIRDDGPLPETHMDLISAQEQYAKLLKGADLILMLSSMLHSIGVGNMTPAGVRLVCVDINPAVVTKLSDRGSLESVGVVTDVGLFLNLLRRRLSELGQERQ